MVCISSCIISAGFIGTWIVFIIRAQYVSKYMNEMSRSLDRNQMEIYKNIIKERRSIHQTSIIIGIILTLIYLVFSKNKNLCLASAILIITNYVVYTLLPKSDYMVLHLSRADQREAWINVYKEMKNNHLIGFLSGIIGFMVLGYGTCK